MPRSQTTDRRHHTVAAFVASVPVLNVGLTRQELRKTALSVVLLGIAAVLHRVLPLLWGVMPDKAPMIAGLASICGALAQRIA